MALCSSSAEALAEFPRSALLLLSPLALDGRGGLLFCFFFLFCFSSLLLLRPFPLAGFGFPLLRLLDLDGDEHEGLEWWRSRFLRIDSDLRLLLFPPDLDLSVLLSLEASDFPALLAALGLA